MEQLNMNQLLNRLNEEKTIKDALIDFEKNKLDEKERRKMMEKKGMKNMKVRFFN